MKIVLFLFFSPQTIFRFILILRDKNPGACPADKNRTDRDAAGKFTIAIRVAFMLGPFGRFDYPGGHQFGETRILKIFFFWKK